MRIDVYGLLERVRDRKPVVHHVTNWVTIFDCAQVVKTLGASPVMAHAPEEVEEMTQLASALVLNIGTLTSELVEAMKQAARRAQELNTPVLLDVCGAGATRFRDQKCFELMEECRISIIKGNSSEVARLSGASVRTRGVDATEVGGDLVSAARKLAQERKATVIITGKQDIITDGQKTYFVNNGHPLMSKVVGTGCMAASVIGTFSAVEKDLPLAAASALACFGVAAELAAEVANSPASFKNALFDCLYRLDRQTVERLQKLETAVPI